MHRIIFYIITLTAFTACHSQSRNIFEVSRNGTVREMEALLSKNPHLVDSVNTGKSSSLILASYHGNEPVALYLSGKVKDINYNSGKGTALMAAVMNGNVAIIKGLLSLKANPDLIDEGGKTALIYASFFNKNDIVKLLLNNGADKTIKDHDGRSALDYATFNKNTELIILLDH